MPGIVVFREPELDHLLNSPNGDVGRYLGKLGRLILFDAKRLVGVRTGELKRTLFMRQARDTRGQFVEIGSPVGHALVHHEGARPHVIIASGRMMRFVVKGRVVYARRVNHPGSRGTHYLTIPLRRHI